MVDRHDLTDEWIDLAGIAEVCGIESRDGWACTRPEDHEPPHAALESRASGNVGVILAVWST